MEFEESLKARNFQTVRTTPEEIRADHRALVFVGLPGTGKTLTAREIVRDDVRLLVLDAHSDDNLLELGVLTDSYPETIREMRSEKFRLVFRSEPDQEKLATLFEFVKTRGDMTLFIDEIADWLMWGRDSTVMALRTLIRVARKRDISLVVTTQRPAEIDKTLFAASKPLIGRMFENNDLLYLSRNLPKPQEILPYVPLPKLVGNDLEVVFVSPLDQNIQIVQVEI